MSRESSDSASEVRRGAEDGWKGEFGDGSEGAIADLGNEGARRRGRRPVFRRIRLDGRDEWMEGENDFRDEESLAVSLRD